MLTCAFGGAANAADAGPAGDRHDVGKCQASLFAPLQPHRFASIIACGTAACHVVSTAPQAMAGASLRYFS